MTDFWASRYIQRTYVLNTVMKKSSTKDSLKISTTTTTTSSTTTTV
jgi:hypothetical protein